MKKIFCKAMFSNFEKEESWLNEMAAKGYNYTDNFIFRYAFEEGKPGEYTYRIILLEKHHNHYESHKVIKFIEETGAECVYATMGWAYFRKKTADGPFEIYTDPSAKIAHYKRHLYLSIVLFSVKYVSYHYQFKPGNNKEKSRKLHTCNIDGDCSNHSCILNILVC